MSPTLDDLKRGADYSMYGFDDLPTPIKDYLRDCPCNVPPQMVRQLLRADAPSALENIKRAVARACEQMPVSVPLDAEKLKRSLRRH